MTGHIDQLAEWWENAEVPTSATLPNDGDRIIIRYNSEWYEIATANGDAAEHEITAYARILARAPKPKPAWHDAIAVIAHTGRTERQVWVREPDGTYSGSAGDAADDYELRDVTPLIEAKVTDEMVKRASAAFWAFDGDADESMPAALHAALGLDPA